MPEALIVELATETAVQDVTSPFDHRIVGSIKLTKPDDVADVLATVRAGAKASAALSRNDRGRILDRAAQSIEDRSEIFARTIVDEAGKTIRQARKEVLRAVNTLRLSAAEARRNAGEVIPFDAYEGSEDRHGWFSREPLGIILAITPFNDPLNLVAHKVGPAIAGGNAVVLKPSALTPLSAQLLAETLFDAGLPDTVLTVVHGGREVARKILAAPDVRMVSFTGGFSTGEDIARTAGLKKLAMDLGGNAPVIVMDDADLQKAVESCVSGAFWAAGQNCVGVQRILVHSSVYQEFKTKFLAETAALVVGDPSDGKTDVGPMITTEAAATLMDKIRLAVDAGAVLLAGGKNFGNLVQPTVAEAVPEDSRLWQEEAFGPLVMLRPVDSLQEAVDVANSIDFSLHAGIFTSSIGNAMGAAKQIQAGGVMINDSSDYRFDGMPFGGFKYGSLGREGVRFAYEDMTQPKVICIKN
ncbi:aldehyde dehydrogenase family protein [Arthrobacter sp. CJ23]|uniref:aldehyde dehydrogenase family protein n=1 Tax=Arthrobacter sp. CJ23 TaxID=2972479 RepID=UPI00215C9A8D|nr:aldehyde dehydrogenase family protein [Arthrobacter sp. CJ23]UVJ41180.1 aldehyde dehydrogenase family protein [Arthrobacter sp. CJ23]